MYISVYNCQNLLTLSYTVWDFETILSFRSYWGAKEAIKWSNRKTCFTCFLERLMNRPKDFLDFCPLKENRLH